ncbi:hypothetical protein [Mycobacterium sp. E3247]|uniref:hypothetical protein n=1 Tax=Mycobacterium sp. E3247 TaxID=1856864 RepID=UPI0007FD8A50|nr:hypothetical protein [Mycobacterium sp. E3247]OBH00096.1 hypothetical protein A9X04_28705 [Mycobacterium sp. E3247]
MVADLLQVEFDRRKAFEARGAALLTASATLLTLIFGLSVFITGKDPVFKNDWALGFLCAALVAFVIAAVVAIFVQARGFDFLTVKEKSLLQITSENSFWGQSADFAVRADVAQKVQMLCSLRRGNNTMATLVSASLWFEVAAIGLLSVSVGVELYTVL